MSPDVGRYEFASDNTATICPEAWAALEEANADAVASYGDDRWTARVCDRIREIFETDCDVYFVFNGTAANALALAQLCQSFHSVVCHEYSHIQTDECGAPEFFTKGSKLLLIGGANGKIDIGQAEKMIARQNELHSHKPRAISIAQATEFGTVYTRDEIAAIAEFARAREMFLHVDGARFAYAVASLNCAPKAITWEDGVDLLCFGGTKNGTAAGELVIFFKKELSAKIDTVFPVDANAVFVGMNEQLVRDLHARGWHFYKFVERDICRLMCSWSTTDQDISDFVADATKSLNG